MNHSKWFYLFLSFQTSRDAAMTGHDWQLIVILDKKNIVILNGSLQDVFKKKFKKL